MSIQVGDKLPSLTLYTPGKEGPEAISTDDVFAGKKVVLFALPGAFTPGCSAAHLPGYVVNVDDIKAKGVDTVACLAVNDAFVMGAWSDAQNAEHILMLADGSAEFTNAVGLVLDLTEKGLGVRSKRYAMIVEDGVVKTLDIDGGDIDKSTAENILSQL